MGRELYRNNLKNREFGQEGAQNFYSERETIAGGQGTSENENYETNPTPPKTDSSGCFDIIDLHCDLLSCVEGNLALTFESDETCCSLPMLLKGGITTQILAIFAITQKGSLKKGLAQLALFDELQKMNGPCYRLAIENASALVEEDEPLDLLFKRLDAVRSPLYLSLTWNFENRFGGGNATNVGLKDEGRLVLEYLSERDIAIDFSHSSDALAWDILNEIDRKQLPLKVMASHSNFRTLQNVPRNLPDDLAFEIIRRGGIIGINFIKRFIGLKKEDILAHFEYGLSLGGENALCFGSDFYGGLNIPKELLPGVDKQPFFEGFENASKFPAILSMLRDKLGEEQVKKIASDNYRRFNTVSPLLF